MVTMRDLPAWMMSFVVEPEWCQCQESRTMPMLGPISFAKATASLVFQMNIVRRARAEHERAEGFETEAAVVASEDFGDGGQAFFQHLPQFVGGRFAGSGEDHHHASAAYAGDELCNVFQPREAVLEDVLGACDVDRQTAEGEAELQTFEKAAGRVEAFFHCGVEVEVDAAEADARGEAGGIGPLDLVADERVVQRQEHACGGGGFEVGGYQSRGRCEESSTLHIRDYYTHMTDSQAGRIAQALDRFRIELPSWGFADTGTRFGKFHQAGAAVTIEEKFRDAAEVNRVTGICPTLALHVLWDFREGKASAGSVLELARETGVRAGAINPNVFQDQIYKLGSFWESGCRRRVRPRCGIFSTALRSRRRQAAAICRFGLRMGRIIRGRRISGSGSVVQRGIGAIA